MPGPHGHEARQGVTAQFVLRLSKKRRNLWHFGTATACELWQTTHSSGQRNLGNGHGNLGERPQTAFAQARGLDGSMAELLDVFADATRKLHPSTAANGLPRRFAMNSAAARSRSDRGNDIKGAESAV
jgi:hypothetical protein